MKKIIVSLSVVAIVAVVAVGANRAVFNDSDSNTGNTFSTGSLVVNLDGQKESTGEFFKVAGMAPGDTVIKCIEVRNDGSLDQIFRVYIDGVTDAKNLANQLKIKVTLRPSSGCVTPSTYTAYGPADAVIVNDQLLSSIVGVEKALNNISAAFENPSWPLMSKYAAVYKVEVSLPMATGNEFQGATLSGTLKVDATQAKNQTSGSVQW